MSFKVHRRDHQLRAERLEARFSPTWTGGPAPTNPVSPNPAPQAPPASSAPPPAPPPAPVSAQPPAPVSPTTTPPVVAPPPTTSAPVVAPPVIPSSVSSSASIAAPPLPPTSSSSSSSIVQTTPTVVATPSSKTTPVLTTPTTFRSLPLASFGATTTTSASPSATSAASSGMSTGGIVGITAASVAGVAVVGVVGIWLLKRYFTSRSEDDSHPEFQRHSWMRNSVALPDDTPSPLARGPSENPRPPTMIERKQTYNLANVGPSRGGYPQDPNGGMAYSDYHDSPYGVPPMPSFNPGQHVSGHSPHSAQPFFSPIGSPPPPSPGMASFDETMPAMQHASYNAATGAPVYFSRHDSSLSAAQPDSAALPDMPNPHGGPATDGYATLDRGSVTPYQAQQYAEISKQLQRDQMLSPVVEAANTQPVHAYVAHEQGPSPFEDPAYTQENQYQELTPPAPAHPRVDSTPPSLPPMRAMSPVGAVGAHASFTQLANAFPAAPSSPAHPTFPPNVASPGSPRSPKSPSFKQAPPLSPAPGAQSAQVISVPEGMHAGRETPVQFGFNDPVPSPAPASAPVEAKAVRRVSLVPSSKRMSVASKKSIPKSGRPETMYDEEDAYGGI